jgi:hypothetical protein
MKKYILLIALFAGLLACQQPASSGSEEPEASTQDSAKVQIEGASEGQKAAATGITPDPDRFPYLESLNDSTTLMHAYSVRFALSHSYPLAPITSDKLMWIDERGSNDTMGVFLTYVIAGREVSLSAVNLRIDYFQKIVPGYESVEAALASSREYFLLDQEKSQLLGSQSVETQSGKIARVEEYYSVRGERYTPKYMALGYLDYNEDYVVSFVLTTTDEFEFKDALPYYYKLMRSFSIPSN